MIDGIEELDLHHLYRAMGFLGEEVKDQQGATPFSPRCKKDMIEESIFSHRRELFTNLDLVFFDTTSIYFEGRGGESIGQRGFSKDHRPDLAQMVVGAVLDDKGQPICCEMWPGNTADVKTLLPIVKRLKTRFKIGRVEKVFRDVKSILETRPIFHQKDSTIRGHVFCSFLALVLRKELDCRLSVSYTHLRAHET